MSRQVLVRIADEQRLRSTKILNTCIVLVDLSTTTTCYGHIGEWHSHHSLSLNRPSDGDEQTIRRNFPQGVTKFLVIIANIKNRDTIKLSPYFFTDGGRRYEKAEVEVLDSEGPFSDAKIMEQIQWQR